MHWHGSEEIQPTTGAILGESLSKIAPPQIFPVPTDVPATLCANFAFVSCSSDSESCPGSLLSVTQRAEALALPAQVTNLFC